MKYLKLFESKDDIKEDIEDILMMEGIFDEWNLLSKIYNNKEYEFQLEPKGNKYLYPREGHSYWGRSKSDLHARWYNSDDFDKQQREISNRLERSRLKRLGCTIRVNWVYDVDNIIEGYKYKVSIWISIIHSS